MPAVELGWKQGADGVEIDVYLSRDQRIVVMHDAGTKRTAGLDKKIVDQNFEDLRKLDAGSWKNAEFAGTKIPELREVLETIPKGRRLFIEVKCGPEIVPRLKEALKAAGQPPEATTVISFNADVCAAVRKQIPELTVYYLSDLKQDKETGQWKPSVDDLIAKGKALGVQGLDVGGKACVDAAFVSKVKGAGLELHVWTIDDPVQARRLAAAGVQSITTNRPAFIRTALATEDQR